MTEPNPYDILLHPYVTEKTMNRIDRENTIEFVVRRTANKTQIRWAIEKLYGAKVMSVNTRISMRGEKHAAVRFDKGVKAEEIGQRIGIF